MRRKLTAILLTLAMVLTLCPTAGAYILGQTVYDDVDYWDGTVDTSWYNGYLDKFIIYTGAQLAGLASMVQSGKTTLEGKTFTLGADIYLNQNLLDGDGNLTSGKHNVWTPIGCYRSGWQPFSGTFNGNGHIISGVYINKTTEFNADQNIGLFGYVHSAEIRNVTVVDSWIFGFNDVGGIVGNVYNSTVANCSFSGTCGGGTYIGGIAGAVAMNSSVYNSFATGRIYGNRMVGGAAGTLDGSAKLESCFSIAALSIRDGAVEKYTVTPCGAVVGTADVGAVVTGCGYLFGTAEAAVGSGSVSAAAFNWSEFTEGYVSRRLDGWANDDTGKWLRWKTDNGYPTLDGDSKSAPSVLLPPAYLRPDSGYVFTKNFHSGIADYSGFSDVKESAWYGTAGDGSLAMTVKLGIMDGYTDGTFKPEGSLKISEAIKMAVNVYDIYHFGAATQFHMGAVWYEEIVAYAIEKGIIKSGDFSDYTVNASRAQMAYIFANALPSEELSAINAVKALPDVDGSTKYSDSIFALYRAGILSGNDETGRFDPSSPVTRAQAAAIISRLAVVSSRKTLTF